MQDAYVTHLNKLEDGLLLELEPVPVKTREMREDDF
jgi:hypothetical protein